MVWCSFISFVTRHAKEQQCGVHFFFTRKHLDGFNCVQCVWHDSMEVSSGSIWSSRASREHGVYYAHTSTVCVVVFFHRRTCHAHAHHSKISTYRMRSKVIAHSIFTFSPRATRNAFFPCPNHTHRLTSFGRLFFALHSAHVRVASSKIYYTYVCVKAALVCGRMHLVFSFCALRYRTRKMYYSWIRKLDGLVSPRASGSKPVSSIS